MKLAVNGPSTNILISFFKSFLPLENMKYLTAWKQKERLMDHLGVDIYILSNLLRRSASIRETGQEFCGRSGYLLLNSAGQSSV